VAFASGNWEVVMFWAIYLVKYSSEKMHNRPLG
jgi:hypothetical protein